jgi:hypothetical protein
MTKKKKIIIILVSAVLFAGVFAYISANIIHGNPESMIYHNRSCRYYNCKACTETFFSKEAAEKAGFRACKLCF